MIIEYVRYRVPEGKEADFESDYASAIVHLKESEYCLGCDLSRCEEEPDRYILRIEWTSTDDHLTKFRGSEAFKRFLPYIRNYIENLEEMQHYTPLGIEFRK